MKIILDANIIISALIRDSAVRAIVSLSGDDFYFPRVAINEIEKYRSLILDKAEITDVEFDILYHKLFRRITLVNDSKLEPFLKEALDIMGKTDISDAVFVACALVYRNSVIWSDDKHYKKQKRIKVWKTYDILQRNNYIF